MKHIDKHQTYRQLYHAANGLENRFAGPSSSSFSKPSRGLLLNRKMISVTIALGLSLGTLISAMNSLSEDSEAEAPGVIEQADEEENKSTVDELPEVSDSGEPSSWELILRTLGFDKGEPKEEEVPASPSTSSHAMVQSPESKPGSSQPNMSRDPKGTEKTPVILAIARGNTLDPKTASERTRHKSNPLFVGRYSRLSKASLTDLELNWATRLVKMGVPVHGRIGRSLLPVVVSVIKAKATKHGLDPTEMIKIASMESGGDPNAVSSTGAIGVYQFTASTARAFGLNNRFDLDANVEAGMLLAKANLKALPDKSKGPLALYIAHQIGIGSAREVLNSPRERRIKDLRPGTQKSIKVNVGGSSETVGEYLDANEAKIQATYDQQLASKPFEGKLEVHLASSQNNHSGQLSNTKESLSTSNYTPSVPKTEVSVHSPSTPDTSFQAKVEPIVKPTPADSASRELHKSFSDASSEIDETDGLYQSAFRTRNGVLVVTS